MSVCVITSWGRLVCNLDPLLCSPFTKKLGYQPITVLELCKKNFFDAEFGFLSCPYWLLTILHAHTHTDAYKRLLWRSGAGWNRGVSICNHSLPLTCQCLVGSRRHSCVRARHARAALSFWLKLMYVETHHHKTSSSNSWCLWTLLEGY